MSIKNIVEETMKLTKDSITWYPLYSNNIISNGQEGVYTYITVVDPENPHCVYSRKYTIKYQFAQDENGCTLRDKIEMYNVFEECQEDLTFIPEIIKPKEDFEEISDWDFRVNDYGDFKRSYLKFDDAVEDCIRSYKFVFGYALSYLN